MYVDKVATKLCNLINVANIMMSATLTDLIVVVRLNGLLLLELRMGI